MLQDGSLAFCDFIFSRSRLSSTSLERSCGVLQDCEKIFLKISKTAVFLFDEMYFQKLSQDVTLAFCDFVFPRRKLNDTSLKRSCEVLRDSEK